MQMLHFESSWDKTLSPKDRMKIQQAFLETSESNNGNIQITPLWQATNHKEELLITVLIHNFSKQVLSFHDSKLRYLENNEIIANHLFNLPSLIIEPETSMPWTFIFPIESLNRRATLENGHLEMD